MTIPEPAVGDKITASFGDQLAAFANGYLATLMGTGSKGFIVGDQVATVPITFSTPFASAPEVIAYSHDSDNFNMGATSITETGFDLVINAGNGTPVGMSHSVQYGWVAFGDGSILGTPGSNGIPAGGDTGQVLTKASDDDYNADWEDVGSEVNTDGFARIAGTVGFGSADFGSMTTPDGKYAIYELPSWGSGDWGFDESAGGSSITFGDDGGIYFNEPGVYATTIILNVSGIQAADPTCTVRCYIDTSDPFSSGFSVVARGGDAAVSHSDLTSTCRVYYDPGEGMSGGMFPGFMYSNLDTANITDIAALIQVQRVA